MPTNKHAKPADNIPDANEVLDGDDETDLDDENEDDENEDDDPHDDEDDEIDAPEPEPEPAKKVSRPRFLVTPEVIAAFPEHDVLITESQTLPCALTNDELLEHGQRLAQLQAELADNVLGAKAAASRAKERSNEITKQIADVGSEIRRRATDRTISTVTLADYKTNAAVTVRQDTVEVISRRALTPNERQKTLWPDRTTT